MTAGVCAPESPAPNHIEGCYEPPAQIDSGGLRLTTFKDVLLLGDAPRGPRYVAISNADKPGSYEFLLFDSAEVKERYRIAPERNQIRTNQAGLSFSVFRRGSGEGVTWKGTGVMTLTSTPSGDLHVEVEITTENRSLIFFSKKERTHLSFELKRLNDRSVNSLSITGGVSDLPGPVEASHP